jgi:hypothetical protein
MIAVWCDSDTAARQNVTGAGRNYVVASLVGEYEYKPDQMGELPFRQEQLTLFDVANV